MCPMHYQRQRLGLELVREYDNAKCSESGCSEKAGIKTGLCKKHYKRDWAANLRHIECTRDGCNSGQTVLGLCQAHAVEERVIKNGPKRGNEHVDKDGYVIVYYPGHPNSKYGNIAKHRLVMSEHLGRPLRDKENVHHKDGNRLNNDINNLELWTRAQPYGQRVEDKIAWAIQFLQEYGYDCVR